MFYYPDEDTMSWVAFHNVQAQLTSSCHGQQAVPSFQNFFMLANGVFPFQRKIQRSLLGKVSQYNSQGSSTALISLPPFTQTSPSKYDSFLILFCSYKCFERNNERRADLTRCSGTQSQSEWLRRRGQQSKRDWVGICLNVRFEWRRVI